MDPDRLAEEKRRGLTIDLGFAWGTLPSGTEIGFVDVPGHERFVANMLAGVGPVRLVLFVVAADEGWKPQSEEHLAILDVLGVEGAVVALTKSDLVDDEGLSLARADVGEHLRGTVLEDAAVVGCSAGTGAGVEELRAALDAMVAEAPAPERNGRARQFLDRVFSIRGAGTVVTGTLTGGPIRVGDEVEISPKGVRARIRGLQTHKRSVEQAQPGSRVAVNLAGAERADLGRGDVLGRPGEWPSVRTFEAELRGVGGLLHGVTDRGAYKLYAGSAERDARIRLYGSGSLEAGERDFARVRLASPLALQTGDRFVLRDTGRRETVAGGAVLDVAPPSRPGRDASERLTVRRDVDPVRIPEIVIAERGAVRAGQLRELTGREPAEDAAARRIGTWWIAAGLEEAIDDGVREAFAAYHRGNPMREGADLSFARAALSSQLRRHSAPVSDDLGDELLDDLVRRGRLAREGATVRLPSHAVSVSGREEELDALVERVAGAEPAPPTVNELVAEGARADVIEAATATGRLTRISSDLVMTPDLVRHAEEIVRSIAPEGVTVSAFRERLGTSRKFALPLLEHLDAKGVTLRRGDIRVLRDPRSG
jgi:selenocysteine-specific elongation factor